MSSLQTLLDEPIPSDHRVESIPFGVAGTEETIRRMVQLANKGKRSSKFRETLGRILEKCGQKDYKCYAKAVHDFCTYEIKYVFDPVDVEYVESPEHVLRARIADCDSKCILFAALCENMGMPVQFVTVKGNPSSNEFSHVYCRVNIPGVGWTASDTTMPNKPFGWEPKGLPEKTWPVSQGGATEMNALCVDSLAGGVVDMQQAIVPLSGLGSLGASESELESFYQLIINNGMYNQLRAAKDESNQMMTDAGKILNAANAITDADQRAKAMQAYTIAQAAASKARNSLFDAIAKYNQVAQAIQTYSGNTIKPQQLGSLGFIQAVAGILALFVAAWYIYKNNSSDAYAVIKQQSDQLAEMGRYVAAGKGIDTQYYGLDPNAAWKGDKDTKSKMTTYAMIGGGLILGILLIKKMKAF